MRARARENRTLCAVPLAAGVAVAAEAEVHLQQTARVAGCAGDLARPVTAAEVLAVPDPPDGEGRRQLVLDRPAHLAARRHIAGGAAWGVDADARRVRADRAWLRGLQGVRAGGGERERGVTVRVRDLPADADAARGRQRALRIRVLLHGRVHSLTRLSLCGQCELEIGLAAGLPLEQHGVPVHHADLAAAVLRRRAIHEQVPEVAVRVEAADHAVARYPLDEEVAEAGVVRAVPREAVRDR